MVANAFESSHFIDEELKYEKANFVRLVKQLPNTLVLEVRTEKGGREYWVIAEAVKKAIPSYARRLCLGYIKQYFVCDVVKQLIDAIIQKVLPNKTEMPNGRSSGNLWSIKLNGEIVFSRTKFTSQKDAINASKVMELYKEEETFPWRNINVHSYYPYHELLGNAIKCWDGKKSGYVSHNRIEGIVSQFNSILGDNRNEDLYNRSQIDYELESILRTKYKVSKHNKLVAAIDNDGSIWTSDFEFGLVITDGGIYYRFNAGWSGMQSEFIHWRQIYQCQPISWDDHSIIIDGNKIDVSEVSFTPAEIARLLEDISNHYNE